MVRLFRREKGEYTLVDGLILLVLMVIVGAVAMPILDAISHRAKVSSTLQNLRTLRTQIGMYRLEHDGEAPLLYDGTLPQLMFATDRRGVPGKPGPNHPYGPYFRIGLPVNPLTSGFLVTLTETFPPVEASGNGGWLYHQETGQIAIDAEGYLHY